MSLKHSLVAVAAVGVLLTLELSQIDDALRYERIAIASGEWWRLFTAHWVHLNLLHALLNSAGLACVMLLVGDCLRIRAWASAILVIAPLVAGALWIVAPELQWYVGLSGVLHGLLAAGALVGFLGQSAHRAFYGGMLFLIALKVGWEQLAGPLPGSATASGGPVIVDAHLFGALAGVSWAALRALCRRACRVRFAGHQ